MSEKRQRLPAAERRARVLEAALELFARDGYAASMGEIARAAGITRTVLYHYFPSKDRLFLVVLEAQAGELLRAVAPAVGGEGTQAQRARRTLAAMLAFAEANPRAWQVLFEPRGETGPEVARAQERVAERMTATSNLLFAADMSEAGLEADSERATIMGELTLGGLVWIVRWWRAHPKVARETVLDAVHDVYWHGLANLPERLG